MSRNRDTERNERQKHAVADARQRNGMGKARSPRYPVYLVLCVDQGGKHYWRSLSSPPGRIPEPQVVDIRGPEMVPATNEPDTETRATERLAAQAPAVALSRYPHAWTHAESRYPA